MDAHDLRRAMARLGLRVGHPDDFSPTIPGSTRRIGSYVLRSDPIAAPVIALLGKCDAGHRLRIDAQAGSTRHGPAVLVQGCTWKRHKNGSVLIACPRCDDTTRGTRAGLVILKPLKAHLNTEKACNARCMNATGPSCECACGGVNHGGSHRVGF